MDKKVSYLSQKTADGSRWTVEQMLTEALAEVAEQRTTPTKALVLFLDDADGQYDVGFRQSGLTMSQALALPTWPSLCSCARWGISLTAPPSVTRPYYFSPARCASVHSRAKRWASLIRDVVRSFVSALRDSP